MPHRNDLLKRARLCRKTAKAMRLHAAQAGGSSYVEQGMSRLDVAANLESLAAELEARARRSEPADA